MRATAGLHANDARRQAGHPFKQLCAPDIRAHPFSLACLVNAMNSKNTPGKMITIDMDILLRIS
jgi:hypothetical protein